MLKKSRTGYRRIAHFLDFKIPVSFWDDRGAVLRFCSVLILPIAAGSHPCKNTPEENPALLLEFWMRSNLTPHNLNSILRTLIRPMFQCHHSQAPCCQMTPVVAKTATRSAIEQQRRCAGYNLQSKLGKLKATEGFWTFGTDMNGTLPREVDTQKGKYFLIAMRGREKEI